MEGKDNPEEPKMNAEDDAACGLNTESKDAEDPESPSKKFSPKVLHLIRDGCTNTTQMDMATADQIFVAIAEYFVALARKNLNRSTPSLSSAHDPAAVLIPREDVANALTEALCVAAATAGIKITPTPDEAHNAEQDLPEAIKKFDVLKREPKVAALDGEEMRKMELAILQNPGDTKAQSELGERVRLLQVEYTKVIEDRLQRDGRMAEWITVIKAGCDDFRSIQVFKLIRSSEKSGIYEYDNAYIGLLARVGTNEPLQKTKQTPATAVELYVEAGRAWPKFKNVVQDLGKRFSKETGVTLKLGVCKTLKAIPRIVEKSILKSKKMYDVRGVKDIVRAMATASKMRHIAIVLRILQEMQVEGIIVVLLLKERFLRIPSGGGWRDIMVRAPSVTHHIVHTHITAHIYHSSHLP